MPFLDTSDTRVAVPQLGMGDYLVLQAPVHYRMEEIPPTPRDVARNKCVMPTPPASDKSMSVMLDDDALRVWAKLCDLRLILP